MSKKINPTGTDGASDPLIPVEVAVLSRVVRAHIIPEADLVSSWDTGPWGVVALPACRRPTSRSTTPLAESWMTVKELA